MRRYESGTATVTERLPVELTVAEAQALCEAWEHIASRVGDLDSPVLTGLRRIAKAYRVEFPEGGE